MKLSTRGKYGLYAMYHLASHAGEGPQTLQQISHVGIPKQYLEQILGNLRRAGLVRTVRGAAGGYQIARRAEDTSLREIIDAVEGPIELSECAASDAACQHAGTCPVRRVWQQVTDSINAELERIRLSDMLDSSCEREEEKP